MMKKFVFLDIDGTLCGEGGRVPESAALAVRKARENGHKVLICSGRSKGEIPSSVAGIGFDGMVASAGAYVEYEGRVLFHRPIGKEKLQRLLAYLEANGAAYALETNGFAYTSRRSYEGIYRRFFSYGGWDLETKEEFMRVFQICGEPGEVEGVNKVCYFDCRSPFEELKRQFEEDFTILPSSIQDIGENNGEISEKGMHKARGIEIVLSSQGGTRQDVIAAGDGLNDMEMVRYAGCGIAMGNGIDELKRAADLVTEDVNEDGIYKAFERLLLFGE